MPYSLPDIVTQQNAVNLEKEGLMDLVALRSVDCSLLADFISVYARWWFRQIIGLRNGLRWPV